MPLTNMPKKGNELVKKKGADINSHPGVDSLHPSHPENQITLGDGHGNPFKLLTAAIYHHFLEMPSEDYEELARIYAKPLEAITREDFIQFRAILARATLNTQAGTLRLIGDLLADRGKCDFFTLLVIDRLYYKGEGPNIEILLSNHDAKFIIQAEKSKRSPDKNFFSDFERLIPKNNHSTGSIFNLKQLIEKNIITIEETLCLYRASYKNCLRLLSYTLNGDNKISIYSHAGIGLEAIESIAKRMSVNYRDKTALQLAATIDNINAALSTYIMSDQIGELYEKDEDEDPLFHFLHPIQYLMWNRSYERINRPEYYYGYHIEFIHGHHDESNSCPAHIYDLNDRFGFPPLIWNDSKDPNAYCSLFSQETLAKKLACYQQGQSTESVLTEPLTPVVVPAPSSGSLAHPSFLSVDPVMLSVSAKIPSQYDTPQAKNLLSQIGSLQAYGEYLIRQNIAKGGTVCEIATTLRALTATALQARYDSKAELTGAMNTLAENVEQEINARKPLLAEHRAKEWVYIKNILIAATLIGIPILVGQLLATKIRYGECRFFFHQTQSMERLNNVRISLNNVTLSVK